MAAPPEAIRHGCVDPRVTSDESANESFGDGCRSSQTDESDDTDRRRQVLTEAWSSQAGVMSMADGELLFLSHGCLGDEWTQTRNARTAGGAGAF